MDVLRRKERNHEKIWRLNDVRIYLQVTYLSCITNKEGNKIEHWALYGPPKANTELEWITRRKPLPENMKAWREFLYQNFTAADGLYPHNLGAIITKEPQGMDIYPMAYQQANAQLVALEPCYQGLVGTFQFTQDMIVDFKKQKDGSLYTAEVRLVGFTRQGVRS